MNSNNYYIRIIESVRRINKVTISSLIEGITSERSYRRYVNQETELNLNILIQLSDRLDIGILDIALYSPNVTTFIKPKDVFHEILCYEGSNNEALLDLLEDISVEKAISQNVLDIYRLRRRYNREDITKSELQTKLLKLKEDVINSNTLDLHKYLLRMEYIQDYYDKKELLSIIEFLNKTDEDKKHITTFMYLAIQVLTMAIKNEHDAHELLFDLSVKLELTCANHILIKSRTLACYFQAHYAYKLNKVDTFEEYIYGYLLGLDFIYQQDEVSKIHKDVENKYHINVSDFLIKRSKECLDKYGVTT